MFKLETMDLFRNEYSIGLDEVKDAWYSFLKEFCALVSYEWSDYLDNLFTAENATFLGSLTISDEAFTEWTIHCKYEEMVTESESIASYGKEHWQATRRKRKRGIHDSRAKMNLYLQLYRKIEQNRKNHLVNKQWQQIFFE